MRKHECPLDGNCRQIGVVYQATIRSKENIGNKNIGVREGPCKQESYTNETLFKNKKYGHNIILNRQFRPKKSKRSTFKLTPKIGKIAPAHST